MKLGPDVLLEIVSIVQDGLVNGSDVSSKLREIEVEPSIDNRVVVLIEEYKNRK